jgi:hypothetical protein
MHEPLLQSATDATRMLSRKEISSRELTEMLLARIEAVNPALNAVVEFRREAALEKAVAADEARHPGDAEFLPPLQRSRLLWLLAERGVGRRCRGRASRRVSPPGYGTGPETTAFLPRGALRRCLPRTLQARNQRPPRSTPTRQRLYPNRPT